MGWLESLFFGTGIAHSVLLLAIVITLGIVFGKVKIAGVSLGMTWILFVGIVFSHFGMRMDEHVLHFVKEFGLILFIYSIGLQVGPSFFSSFKKGGMTLNFLATLVVLIGVIVTYVVYKWTGLPISTMVGILSGAVTNTPGLGAAQQTYMEATGVEAPDIALGYAVAYPLGVIGIIFSIIAIKYVFNVKFENERTQLEDKDTDSLERATHISVEVKNMAVHGKSIVDISKLSPIKFVISRILHKEGAIEIPRSRSVINEGDKLLIVTALKTREQVTAFLGTSAAMHRADWNRLDEQLISRKIVVTKKEVNGKGLDQLNLRALFGVTVTRVNRAGIDLVADAKLKVQIGDRLTVVGNQEAIDKVADFIGNSMKHLFEPNLVPIFTGIFIGIIVGSIPFLIPGIPQPVKLGLAGGPLIVSILISRFGPKYKLITYTTVSANLMLREIGISLFLACVGLQAGENFVQTIVDEGGYAWVGYGVIITLVPLLVVGVIARLCYKLNYFTIMGLLAGSTTDPPALSYSNSTSGNDQPSVAYATVYPLTMFLRVLSAQLLILIFL